MRLAKFGVYGALVTSLTVGLVGCGSTGSTSNAPTSGGTTGKTLNLVLDGTSARQNELQAVAQYLTAVGIHTQVRLWESSTLTAEVKKGGRTMYASDWGSSTFDPFDLAVPKLQTGGRGNFSFYSNPTVDTALAAGATGTDNTARQQAYQQAQSLIYKDAPWIFGYYMDILQGVSKNVTGYKTAMDNHMMLQDVQLSGGSSTLNIGLNTDHLVTLDPAEFRDRETGVVLKNIFDGLIGRDQNGQLYDEIAQSWKQLSPTVYDFQLRHDVKFQNNQPLTAADVKFSFDRILSATGVNGQQSPRLGLLGPLQEVQIVSPYEVKFVLSKPSPVFPQLLVETSIVPKAYVQQHGDTYFSQHPIGAGALKFVSGDLSSQVTLAAWSGYYGNKPSVQSVVFKMMPEPSTRISSLLAGETQIIEDVPADLVAKVQSSSNAAIATNQGTRAYMIEINNKVVTDPRVREAMNYAIDWDTILKTIYHGDAHRLSTGFLPSGFGYDSSLQPYPYDPTKAKQLLQAAGYSTN